MRVIVHLKFAFLGGILVTAKHHYDAQLIRAAVYLQLIQVCKGTSTANKRIG